SGRAGFRQASPKVSLDYALHPSTHLYALISEGGRSGGFNTGAPIGAVFVTSPGVAGLHRRFDPDELWNFEVGAKLRLFDDRFEMRTALFYDNWRKIQTDQFLTSGLSFTANA